MMRCLVVHYYLVNIIVALGEITDIIFEETEI